MLNKWYKKAILTESKCLHARKRAANTYLKLLGFKSQTDNILQALDYLL